MLTCYLFVPPSKQWKKHIPKLWMIPSLQQASIFYNVSCTIRQTDKDRKGRNDHIKYFCLSNYKLYLSCLNIEKTTPGLIIYTTALPLKCIFRFDVTVKFAIIKSVYTIANLNDVMAYIVDITVSFHLI